MEMVNLKRKWFSFRFFFVDGIVERNCLSFRNCVFFYGLKNVASPLVDAKSGICVKLFAELQ